MAVGAASAAPSIGQRSEQLDLDQLQLGLEDAEQGAAEDEAAKDASEPSERRRRSQSANRNRGALPAHLPRYEVVIDIESKECPCCGGALHVIGEDRAEQLDIVPAQLRVKVLCRPRYGCRACESAVVQAPAPERPIDGGMATEALIAHVVVSKFCDSLPLYRQGQMLKRQGITLDRSTLSTWVGRACWWLKPLYELVVSTVLSMDKVFADETTLPVLDPGRGKTKTGQGIVTVTGSGRPMGTSETEGMKPPPDPYYRHRFPAELISHAIWLYHVFSLSLRDVELLLAERGIVVSYETVRRWCKKFGRTFANRLRRRRPRPGDTWYLDEVFIRIEGVQHYLWRAVDQDGVVLDILVQPRRDAKAAKRFFRRLLKGLQYVPRVIVTDKLRSYGVAQRQLLPKVEHRQSRYLNNRAENSHRPTRRRERQMQRFKSPGQAQDFLSAHAFIHGHFHPRRHLLTANAYRAIRTEAFGVWQQETCAQLVA